MDYINKIKQFNRELENESDETTIMKINGNQTPTETSTAEELTSIKS